jgi:hypothetical protein
MRTQFSDFKSFVLACLVFFRLMFWTLPLKRESNGAKKGDIGVGYVVILMLVLVEVSEPRPFFTEAGFPTMSQLSVVQGVLIEHPTERDSKYHTAPIGLRTLTGDVFKKCSNLGVSCTVEIVGNQGIGWRTYLGKPARMWFFDDLVIQLEIDGKIPFRFSYEESERIYTVIGGYWFFLLIFSYVFFRLIQRYATPAFEEAFKVRSSASNTTSA